MDLNLENNNDNNDRKEIEFTVHELTLHLCQLTKKEKKEERGAIEYI